MPALRILGGILALAYFILAIRRYRRRQISRLNLIISCVIAIVVVLLALAPSLFNPIFTRFNFGPGNDRRLIFVLMVAVLVLFGLVLRVQSISDVNERSIRLLVEAFGQERFDWERVAALPGGTTARDGLARVQRGGERGCGDRGDAATRSRATASCPSW